MVTFVRCTHWGLSWLFGEQTPLLVSSSHTFFIPESLLLFSFSAERIQLLCPFPQYQLPPFVSVVLLLQILGVFISKMVYFVAWNEMPRCKVLSHSLNLLSLVSSELSGSVAGCLTLVGNSPSLLIHYLFSFSLTSFPHAVRMLHAP